MFDNIGFYTYLYIGSITFMCYIFFYVLRVRVQGHALNHNKLEMDEFIKRMTQATGVWQYMDFVSHS
jgi:hypothetical protein